VSGIYEVDKTSSDAVTRTVTSYPVASAMRINSTLNCVLKNHLGSASVVTDTASIFLKAEFALSKTNGILKPFQNSI
jgi:hypothetical protein